MKLLIKYKQHSIITFDNFLDAYRLEEAVKDFFDASRVRMLEETESEVLVRVKPHWEESFKITLTKEAYGVDKS